MGRPLAAGEGFEPSHTESESAVLPLHNPAMFAGRTFVIIPAVLHLSRTNCQFSGFFSFWCRGLFLTCVSAAKPLGRRGREAASARGEVPVPRVRAEDGGRPKRELAVSAEGKSANFTDLVKMPIPFCTLSCYTAYIKASERSTDYDRNEPQC